MVGESIFYLLKLILGAIGFLFFVGALIFAVISLVNRDWKPLKNL